MPEIDVSALNSEDMDVYNSLKRGNLTIQDLNEYRKSIAKAKSAGKNRADSENFAAFVANKLSIQMMEKYAGEHNGNGKTETE